MNNSQRPNVLLITTDQQSAFAMSCAGNPDVQTPAMDQLAAQGTRFEAAYATNPICVPSRTSYMTGTTPHENGVFTNVHAGDIDLSVPCLAQVFRDHGYDTAHFGKWHVPRPLDEREWSGFNTIEIQKNNGVDLEIPGAIHDFFHRERDQPFFAIASFVNPHDICEWARRLSGIENELRNGEIEPPPTAETCPPLRTNRQIPVDEPSVIREHQRDSGMKHAYPTRDWSDEDPRWRQYLWGYYRLVEKVDHQIGQVLASLEAAGQRDNTVIVFASDHGDGMGAHAWNQKTLFYEEVARVPFIISGPAGGVAKGVNRSHLVNLGLDLFPTMFELAGLSTPQKLRGVSAAPFAIGTSKLSSRPFIVCENNLHHDFGKPGEVHGRMVRSARYKYICYSHGEHREQLFDLHEDPTELQDLSECRESHRILEDHRQMLTQYVRETKDPFAAFIS